MDNSQRYRLNAAECLLAVKTCRLQNRGLILAVAASWDAFARQDEVIEKLLLSWDACEPG
jgi:hypothetical protein